MNGQNDEASDRLRWKSVKLTKDTRRAAEATKREQGDTAQGSGAMSRNAKTSDGARADGGTRKEGRTRSDARTDWTLDAASEHEWKTYSGARSGCSLLDVESCDS